MRSIAPSPSKKKANQDDCMVKAPAKFGQVCSFGSEESLPLKTPDPKPSTLNSFAERARQEVTTPARYRQFLVYLVGV